ncbi:MAG: RNase J family beta-CASP ribonuclease [Candidatus Yonathbacteria bacterium]|nr:RNase J family beta-CASP ribonuclease [Candidatus Yonathbacteria bacterium]
MIEREGRNTQRGGSDSRRPGQSQPRPPVRNTQTGARPQSSTHPHGTHTHGASKPAGRGSSVGHRRSPLRRDRKGSHQTRRPSMPFPSHRREESVIPPLAPGNVRVIPLGGVEEIGKNMTVVEYKDTIIVVDAGIQFKEESTPGIDFILPNTKYLEERKHKVKAIVITHGHLDHIGAIPYIMDKIGNPPLYSRNLTTLMIKKRQEEFTHLPPIDIRVVEKNDRITVGDLTLKFFAVTHTIPDSMGIMIETPYGNIVHTGDLKLDHNDGVPTEAEVDAFEQLSTENNLMLLADSTNVERPGFSIPEKVVFKNIEKIIREIQGRLIVATFSSLLERLIKVIEVSEKLGKKIVVDGRSMKNNIEIAKLAGMLVVQKDTIIPIEQMDNYPPDRIIVLATGAQGDEFASLMRAANKTHKYLKINKRDTVLLSSSIVPGNERNVQKLKDNLSRQGAKIIHYMTSDVHSSGHANHDEALWIHKKIKPKFFIPAHGYHYMLRVHAEIAKEAGVPESNIIIPDNGMIIEIQDNGQKAVILKENAPKNLIMVDGFSVGDIQEVVIRDRQMLAQDGIFVIIASIDVTTGRVRKSPDIISRGFVYLRESQDLLHQARLITKKTIEDMSVGMNPINFDYIKDQVTDNVSKFLFQETAKRPMVLPVLLGM